VKQRALFVVGLAEKKIRGRAGVGFSQQLDRRTPLPLLQQVPQLLCFLIVHLRRQEPTTNSRGLRSPRASSTRPCYRIVTAAKCFPHARSLQHGIFQTAALRTPGCPRDEVSQIQLAGPLPFHLLRFGPEPTALHTNCHPGGFRRELSFHPTLASSTSETHDWLPAVTTDGTQLAQEFQNLVAKPTTLRQSQLRHFWIPEVGCPVEISEIVLDQVKGPIPSSAWNTELVPYLYLFDICAILYSLPEVHLADSVSDLEVSAQVRRGPALTGSCYSPPGVPFLTACPKI